MSKKLAPGPEIELTRLSSRGRSWRKAKAEAKAKEYHERKNWRPRQKLNCQDFQVVDAHGEIMTLSF